jgi:dihydropteroate synthase
MKSWQIKTKTLELSKPLIMGVVNVTTDSFSGDGVIGDQAIKHAQQLLDAGADILDIGGESSRPGAVPVSVAEELERVLPVVEHLIKNTQAIISVDTRHAEVAKVALKAGAHIINDITGFSDPAMIAAVKDSGAGLVVMHMQGQPQTMQADPQYDDVVAEVGKFLKTRVDALVAAGIDPAQIVVDPGIGFGKTLDHNLELLRNLPKLTQTTGRPLLLGVSRKSFIGKLTGVEEPAERVWGTAAAVAWCVAQGASIVRVHDVSAMRQVAQVTSALRLPLL